MIDKTISGNSGYDIHIEGTVNPAAKRAIIIAHGFDSSTKSPTVRLMLEAAEKAGTTAIAFDFPAHGQSPVSGDDLSVANCINDMKTVEKFALESCPEATIGHFGSSFGAYITMLRLASGCINADKAFLRSAAVNMHEIFRVLPDEYAESLVQNGYYYQDRGNGQHIKITKAFLEDLETNELTKRLENSGVTDSVDVKMIHGSCDETIDYAKAKAFAEKFGIDLITVEGGDHRLMLPNVPEKLVETAIDFFR